MLKLIKDIREILSSEQLTFDYYCCTINQTRKTNGDLVMGAGVAKIYANLFPQLPSIWGNMLFANQLIAKTVQLSPLPIPNFNISQYDPLLFARLPFGQNNTIKLIGFPSKYYWKDNSDIALIERSAQALQNFLRGEDVKILLPAPGVACGNLSWDQVEPILNKYLDHRVTILSKYNIYDIGTYNG